MENTEETKEVTVVEKPTKKESKIKPITYTPYKRLPKDLSLIKLFDKYQDIYFTYKDKVIFKQSAILGQVPTLYYVGDRRTGNVIVCGVRSEVNKFID